jgi:hypothetical protein
VATTCKTRENSVNISTKAALVANLAERTLTFRLSSRTGESSNWECCPTRVKKREVCSGALGKLGWDRYNSHRYKINQI